MVDWYQGNCNISAKDNIYCFFNFKETACHESECVKILK